MAGTPIASRVLDFPSGRRLHPKLAFRALLVATVVLPLIIAGVGGWLAWRDAWRDAQSELVRTAEAGAAFAARVLGAHVLAAELVNHMLAGLTDEEIRAREPELSERLHRLVPSVPMTNTIALSDRDAIMLLTANVMPVPRVSIEDREWVRALRQPDAPRVHVSSVTTGRVDDNFFFGVSIRRAYTGNGLPVGAFDGVVNISVHPTRLAAGLETVTRRPEDAIALVRTDGEVLSRVPFFTARPPPIPADSPLRRAMAAGMPGGVYEGRTLAIDPSRQVGAPLTIAYRRVGDLPVYVTVSRPPAAIFARWRGAMLTLLAVAVPASLALGVLALLVRRSQRRIAASEAEFRTAFEGAPIGAALADAATGRILRANQSLCELTGRAEAELVGTTLADLVHPDDRQGHAAGGWRAVFRGGSGATLRIVRAGGPPAWALVSLAGVKYPAGDGPAVIIASVQDITRRKASEERAALLAREVDHRAKNMLGVVQSLVRLTQAGSVKDYARILQGRITALARAQTLLSSSRWEGADLRRLVEEELAPHREGRAAGCIRVAGACVLLSPRAAQSFAMALHELSTNSVKHGALSQADGCVSVEWTLDRDPWLTLRWTERGGPAAGPPSRRGVGLSVIEQAVVRQLDGTVRFDWRADGLDCEIGVPAGSLVRAAA